MVGNLAEQQAVIGAAIDVRDVSQDFVDLERLRDFVLQADVEISGQQTASCVAIGESR